MPHCLLVSPFGMSGLGQHGYYFSRAMLQALNSRQFDLKLIPNGELQRPDIFLSNDPRDQALKLALERSDLEPHASAASIVLCQPAQYDQVPGRFRVANIVFEGSRIPKEELPFLQSADAIAVPSRWGAECVRASFAAHRLAVPAEIWSWPLGVDAEVFSRPAETALGTTAGPLAVAGVFTFLQIAKWEKRKGCRELLKSFAALAAKNPTRPLRLLAHWVNSWNAEWKTQMQHALAEAGFHLEGPQAGIFERYRSTATPHAFIDVIIAPLRNQSDVKLVYLAADAGVYPHYAEGWGLPLMESMAMGVPCIASAVSGSTEFLTRETALLLEHGTVEVARDDWGFAEGDHGEWRRPDVEEIAQQMQAMLDQSAESRSQLATRAVTDIQRRFSWEKAASHAVEGLFKFGLKM